MDRIVDFCMETPVEAWGMELNEAVDLYFRGEKQLGASFVYLGLLTLAAGYWAWRTQSGGFATAMALTSLVLGLGLTGAGAWFESKTTRQIEELHAQLERDPRAMAVTEVARMAKVNQNWAKARIAWLVAGIVGALLLNFARANSASAIGLALVAMTAVLFVVDELGERRAERYTSVIARHAETGQQPR